LSDTPYDQDADRPARPAWPEPADDPDEEPADGHRMPLDRPDDGPSVDEAG
jgi:hypothetical protein